MQDDNYNNISQQQKLYIAKDILNECTWGNTRLTPNDVIKFCEDRNDCKIIFSKIFQSSRSMYEHLRLIKREWVIELINKQQVPRFNHQYFKKRKDILIKLFIDSNHKVEGLEWK